MLQAVRSSGEIGFRDGNRSGFMIFGPAHQQDRVFCIIGIKNIPALKNISIFVKNADMKRTVIQNPAYPDCPVRNVLAKICDQWAILVLGTLWMSGKHALRFTEIRKQVPDVSQRMLSMTLRTLEEDGYISRNAFAEIPPRVEYALTERGLSLMPLLSMLFEWARMNMAGIMHDRRRHLRMPESEEEGNN